MQDSYLLMETALPKKHDAGLHYSNLAMVRIGGNGHGDDLDM